MSEDQDNSLIILEGSFEEGCPSLPKRGRGRRGRGRGKSRGRGNAASRRAAQPRSARQSSTSRRSRSSFASQGRVSNLEVIPVGDIDTDEEDLPTCPLETFTHRAEVTTPPLGAPITIDKLAQVMGITDESPLKDSNTTISDTEENKPASPQSPNNPLNEIVTCDVDQTCASASTSAHSIDQTDIEKSITDPVTSDCHPATSSENQPSTSANCSQTDAKPAVAKKTARRGLAKKDSGLSAPALDPGQLTKHISAVYSQCVATGGLRSLFQPSGQAPVSNASSSSQVFDSDSGETQSEVDSQSDVENTKTRQTNTSSLTSTDRLSLEEEIGDNEKEDSVNVSTDVSLVLRSPTPPPELKTQPKKPLRNKKMTKKLSNALQTLNNVKGTLQKLEKKAVVPPMFRSRGKRKADVICVGEEEGIEKNDMTVKVRYLSTVYRVNLNMDDPLHTLTERMAFLIGDVEQHNLSLFLRDQQMELRDSPRSVGLSVADIIDCHHIKGLEAAELDDEDCINVVVQCRHSRTKSTISAAKNRPLRDVIHQYAKKNNLDANDLRLTFDGEAVNPNDTPSILDMEDFDVMDVFMIR